MADIEKNEEKNDEMIDTIIELVELQKNWMH